MSTETQRVPFDEDGKVVDHVSDEIKAALTTGDPECLVVSRRMENGERQVIHVHDNEVEECPLMGLTMGGRAT